MAFFNYDAKVSIYNGEFQLSQHDLELIEINSNEWSDKSKPPYDLCRYLMEMIELRLSDILDDGSKDKLGAAILGMNYFQFKDYIFKAKSDTNKRIDLRKTKKTLNTILNSDMEKHRQAQEAKLGLSISPKEHKLNYKANYAKIRMEKIIQSLRPKRVAEIRNIIANYESLAVECVSFIPDLDKSEIPIGCTKLGGHAHMLDNETYPVDEHGKGMVLLAQINVAEINQLLPNRLIKKEGLLSFFATDENLGGQRYHGFTVRYYPDINSLSVKTPLRSKSYHETRLVSTKINSLPISPWSSYELFENKMGSEAIHIEDFIQDKYSYHGTSLLGYGMNIEMRPMIKDGKEITEDMNHYIPLLLANSQHDQGVEKRLVFGDAGAVGFFIKPDDLDNWNFDDVVFTTYN